MRIYRSEKENIQIYSDHKLDQEIKNSIHLLGTISFESKKINRSCGGKCGILSHSIINNNSSLKGKGFLVFNTIGNYPNSRYFSTPHISGQPHVLIYSKLDGHSIAIDLTTLQSSNIKMQIYVSKSNSVIKTMISQRYNTSVNSIEIIPHNKDLKSASNIFSKYRNLNSKKLKQQIPKYITNKNTLIYLEMTLSTIRQLKQSKTQLTNQIFNGPMSIFKPSLKKELLTIINKLKRKELEFAAASAVPRN